MRLAACTDGYRCVVRMKPSGYESGHRDGLGDCSRNPGQRWPVNKF